LKYLNYENLSHSSRLSSLVFVPLDSLFVRRLVDLNLDQRPVESISTARTLASEPGLCTLQPVLPASAAMAPSHPRAKPRNTKSKRSQILLALSFSRSLTSVWVRFLEKRAAGAALPSATKPQVSKISRLVSGTFVVQR
jgi:hypothetical protein